MAQVDMQRPSTSSRRRSSRRSRIPKLPMFLNCPPNPPYTNYMDEEPALKFVRNKRKLTCKEKYDYSSITRSSRFKCLTNLRYKTMDEINNEKPGYPPKQKAKGEDEEECYETQFITIPAKRYPPKEFEKDDNSMEDPDIGEFSSPDAVWDQGQGEPSQPYQPSNDLEESADADCVNENASGSCTSKSADLCEDEQATAQGFNYQDQGYDGAVAPYQDQSNVAQFANQGQCANQGQAYYAGNAAAPNVEQFAYQGQQQYNGNVDQFAYQGGQNTYQGQQYYGNNAAPFAYQGQNNNQGQQYYGNAGAPNVGQFAYQQQNYQMVPNVGQFSNQGQPNQAQSVSKPGSRPAEFICCMCQQQFLCSKMSDNCGLIQH